MKLDCCTLPSFMIIRSLSTLLMPMMIPPSICALTLSGWIMRPASKAIQKWCTLIVPEFLFKEISQIPVPNEPCSTKEIPFALPCWVGASQFDISADFSKVAKARGDLDINFLLNAKGSTSWSCAISSNIHSIANLLGPWPTERQCFKRIPFEASRQSANWLGIS